MAHQTDPRNPPYSPPPADPVHNHRIPRYGDSGRTGLFVGGVVLALLVLLFVLGAFFGSDTPIPADGTAPVAPAVPTEPAPAPAPVPLD